MTKVITRSIPDATVAPSRKERSTHVTSDAPKRHQGVATQQKIEGGRAPELDPFESFSKGKDVAIALLADLESSRGRDVTCFRRHRDGRPQFRYWRKHLEELIANPGLVEGFDAVMSAAFEDGAMLSATELSAVRSAEFAAGVVGDDGTEPDDERESARKACPAVEIDPLHGHTPAQAGTVFGFIATRANAARQYCSGSADSEYDQAIVADMFEQIGIAADQMIGGEIVGTAADWMIGHSFHQAGKAVQA